jgi:hypothetical protein
MMTVLGINQALLGIAGIADDNVYVPVGDYVYGFDLTAWGWFHLVFGIAVAAAGVFVLRGAAWARGVALGLTMVNLIATFAFIPYHPVWSLLLIAFDVAVIWGLTTSAGRGATHGSR